MRKSEGCWIWGEACICTFWQACQNFVVTVQSLSSDLLMDCSMPGFPVLHHLLEYAQTHVRWCYPSISSSVFLCCLQSFPALGSFPRSGLLSSGGQSIGASASMIIKGWFPLGLTGLITLLSKGPSRVFYNTTVWKHKFFGALPSLWSYSHIHTWLLEKPYLWLDESLSAKWCLCFSIWCLGWSKLFFQGASILISRLQSPSAAILEPKK